MTIHEAAQSGQARLVRQYLEADPSLVHARDADMRTPLHRAAMSVEDDTETVLLLLSYGADAQAHDKDGWTARDWADFYISRDVCLILPPSGIGRTSAA